MDTVVNARDRILKRMNWSKSNKVSEYLYLLGLTIYVLVSYTRGTMIVNNFGINIVTMTYALYLGSFLVVLKILLYDDIFNWKYLACLILTIFFFSIGKQAKDFDLFYYFIFIIGANNIDFKRILKVFLVVNIVGIVITLGLVNLGLIKNVVITRTDSPAVRYSLGAIYPTDFAARIFFMLVAYFCLKDYKLTIPQSISVFAIIILTYLITDTRLDFLLMLLAFVSVLLSDKVLKLLQKIAAKYVYIGTVGGIFLTIMLGYIYRPGNVLLDKINSLLSGRLFFEYIAFKDYNVDLLGQFVYQNGSGGGFKITNYFFIDSSYVRYLLMYGLVGYISIVIILLLLERKLLNEKKYTILISVILVLLSSVIDQHILGISYNIFLLALTANLSSLGESEKRGIESVCRQS